MLNELHQKDKKIIHDTSNIQLVGIHEYRDTSDQTSNPYPHSPVNIQTSKSYSFHTTIHTHIPTSTLT